MAGKQAKVLQEAEIGRVLRRVRQSRYATRDRVLVLLSVKAGLRAAEMAGLRWSMVLDAKGEVGAVMAVADGIAKKRSGRSVPLQPELRSALVALWREARRTVGRGGWRALVEAPVLRSARGGPLRATSVVNWFRALYGELGLVGCSSHSGRRTFVTRAARLVFRAGGSLRDVQQLAGHRSIEQTQAYIDGSSAAKRRLVALL